MKSFLIFVIIVAAGGIWLKNWVISGRMDNYLQQNKGASTPKILYALSEMHFYFQNHKTACHYYRWLIRDYPDHPNIAKVYWQLGQCYDAIGEKQQAMEQYVILKDSFTATEFGQLAQNKYQHFRY